MWTEKGTFGLVGLTKAHLWLCTCLRPPPPHHLPTSPHALTYCTRMCYNVAPILAHPTLVLD